MDKYINFYELGIGKCNPDCFPTGYAEGWNNLFELIEKAPEKAFISLGAHEQMKRELYCREKACEAAAQANRILYEQAVKDIRFLLEFIERKRQEVLIVNKITEEEMCSVCEKFCENAGRLCFKEGDEPFKCEGFSYNGESRVYKSKLQEDCLSRTGSDTQEKDFSEGLSVTSDAAERGLAPSNFHTYDIAHCYKCGAELKARYFETGIPFTLLSCSACGFELKCMGDIQNSIEEYNEAVANEGKNNPGAC